MKIRNIFCLFIICMFCLSDNFVVFAEEKDVNLPQFSVEQGVYKNAFELELTAPDGYEIYYTTDGSAPSVDSILYSNPINIYNCSIKTNDISAITTISTQLVVPPSENVDKAMIIRAISVSPEGNISDIVTKTYIVGLENSDLSISGLDIVSLVIDKDDLFDYSKGIYVTGKTYDDWKNSVNYNENTIWSWMPANYHNSGKQWERKCDMAIIQTDGKVFSQEVGIRIHGGATRAFLQKSFSLYARSEYGAKKFKYDIFNGQNRNKLTNDIISEYDSFLLRNSGNDRKKARFRDKLNQDLVNDRNIATQDMRPCIVFINGEYWGQYEITEKISSDYIEENYGVKSDDVELIKNGELEDGIDADLLEYKELYAWIKSSDFTEEANYANLNKKIDIKSYIDYMCSEMYVANEDWGNNNYALWKSRTVNEENPYSDGRWRFILFDTDYGAGLTSDTIYKSNYFKRVDNSSCFLWLLYSKLISNAEFKKQFVQTFLDMMNNNYNAEKVKKVIDAYASEYESYAIDFSKRFTSNKILTSEQYREYIDVIQNFYENRSYYCIEHMKNKFDITDELVELSVANDNQKGRIRLNESSFISVDDDLWKGQYFNNMDISLEAVPNDGYSFKGWRVDDYPELINGNIYSFVLTGNTSVEAVFEESDKKICEWSYYTDTAFITETDKTGVEAVNTDFNYGDKSTGYYATSGKNSGTAKLYASINGTAKRKLEWSAETYKNSGKHVPVMTAGNKNPWEAALVDDVYSNLPYFEVECSTKGYENLTFSASLGGSKKGPAEWKLQYSLDGVNYEDVTVSNPLGGGYTGNL